MIKRLSALVPLDVKGFLRTARFNYMNRRFVPYVVQKDIDGVQLDFYVGDIVGKDWYGTFDRLTPELIFIRDNLIKPGDIVLECGAHHGLTTLLFACWVGASGHVTAFEASPPSAHILEKNVEINRLDARITVEQKAVSSCRGEITISEESNAMVVPGQNAWSTHRVPTIDLDSYRDLLPTFIKLDIEGFEIEALRGAQRVLGTLPKLAIEVHGAMLKNYGYDAREIFERVMPEQYEFWLQIDDSVAPQPYQGEDISNYPRIHLYCLPRRDARETADRL